MGFRINQNCIKGTNNVATNNDIPKIKVIAHGKDNRKSCIIPVMVNKNGKKVILIANVADKMDLKK